MSKVLKRNREAHIEARCLRSSFRYAEWKAHLFKHDDPTVITEDVYGVEDPDTHIIVFVFGVEQINLFADGDKLDIEIWPTNNLTDMYWEKKAYKVEESYVPTEVEQQVTFEDGYFVGAEIDDEGYLITSALGFDRGNIITF